MKTFEEWCQDREIVLNELSPKLLTMAYKIWGEDCFVEGQRHEAENADLRTELEDYKIEERRAERISKYKREDARRVADKIARCCLAHCGHKVRIEAQDGFWIETCTYPPYHGKWIVEIEKCPKAEEAQKSAEARLAEMKGEQHG